MEKKTRHATGDGASALVPDDEIHDVDDVNPMTLDDSDGNSWGSDRIHMLSHPLDPNDSIRIARELRSLMLSEVKSAVIEAVKEAIVPLQTQIDVLKSDTRQLQDENVDLKSRVDELEKKVATNEDNIDILEQYSRRNTPRISGIPEEPNESTDTHVLELASDLNVNLFGHDIDRSHRVGKPSSTKTRDIIVNSSRYNARRMLYEVRKDLRELENRASVFINEDLTNRRSKLLFDARTLVCANLLTGNSSFVTKKIKDIS